MIRNSKTWKTKLAALPQAEKNKLLKDLSTEQNRYEQLCIKNGKRYKKGEITAAQLAKFDAEGMAVFQTWALENGYYEDISEEGLAAENLDLTKKIIMRHGKADLEEIALAAINKHRASDGKAELTKSDLLDRIK
jgi:hypothetical protein